MSPTFIGFSKRNVWSNALDVTGKGNKRTFLLWANRQPETVFSKNEKQAKSDKLPNFRKKRFNPSLCCL